MMHGFFEQQREDGVAEAASAFSAALRAAMKAMKRASEVAA
jgi:hypothetical protein